MTKNEQLKRYAEVIDRIIIECKTRINPDLRWLDRDECNHREGQEWLAEEILDRIPKDMIE